MIDELLDPTVARAIRALKAYPPHDARNIQRVMTAVRARPAMRPGVGDTLGARVAAWFRTPSLATTGMLAAAALVIGFVTRGIISVPEAAPEATVAAGNSVSSAPSIPMQPASNSRTEPNAVPVPIVFEAGNAKSVSVVGDFNDWDATAAPMKRFGKDGPWTATLLAKPGRHVYAFLVDGQTLVADPRAPRARDLDYGGDASVLMVTPQ
jgi:hypothetical protein